LHTTTSSNQNHSLTHSTFPQAQKCESLWKKKTHWRDTKTHWSIRNFGKCMCVRERGRSSKPNYSQFPGERRRLDIEMVFLKRERERE
jgi:hypothetical protein